MTHPPRAEPPSFAPDRSPNDAFPNDTLTMTAVLPRPESRRRPWQGWTDRTWLRALFICALIVRLGFVLLPPVWNRNLRWGDEWTYDEIATTLLNKGYFGYAVGSITLYRPPLYPALMAAMYGAFGHKFPPLYVLQALCGAVSAPLVALIGRRITGSRAVGLVAGVIFVFTPLLVYMTAVLYMETVYIALLLGVVLLWLKLVTRPLPANWLALAIGSGLLFGLSLLMRPTFFAFAPFFFVWAWAVLRSPKQAALVTAVVTMATFVVVLPWTYRNTRIRNGRGAVVLVSANGGINLFQGNNDSAKGRAGGALDLGEYPALPNLTEAQRDKVYARWGLNWIKSHPGEFLRRVPVRLGRFFSPLETGNNGQAPTKAAFLLFGVYAVYYVFALAGLARSVRNWRIWLLPYLLIAYSAALAGITYGNTRFGLIVQPFILLFVADALVAAWQRLQAKRTLAAAEPVRRKEVVER